MSQFQHPLLNDRIYTKDNHQDFNDKNNLKNSKDKKSVQKEEQTEDFIQFDTETPKKEKDNDQNSKKIHTMFRSDNIEVNEERIFAPWISEATTNIKNANIRLHNEIVEFTNYIAPSKQDYQIRLKTINNQEKILKTELPGVEVKPFGNFVTGLYLPNTIIEIVLFDRSREIKSLIKDTAKALHKHGDKYTNLAIIKTSTVPFLKFEDRQVNVTFDLTFNNFDEFFQFKEITKAFKVYPEIRYLIFVQKIFLKQRDQNAENQGGIGSFLLFCVVLTFLREYKRDVLKKEGIDGLKDILLSEYLVKLQEFYGVNFDFYNKRIIMDDGGKIVNKEEKDNVFCIMSPQYPEQNMGVRSFRIKEIFLSMKNRYYFQANYNFKQGESILKYQINPSKKHFEIYLN